MSETLSKEITELVSVLKEKQEEEQNDLVTKGTTSINKFLVWFTFFSGVALSFSITWFISSSYKNISGKGEMEWYLWVFLIVFAVGTSIYTSIMELESGNSILSTKSLSGALAKAWAFVVASIITIYMIDQLGNLMVDEYVLNIDKKQEIVILNKQIEELRSTKEKATSSQQIIIVGEINKIQNKKIKFIEETTADMHTEVFIFTIFFALIMLSLRISYTIAWLRDNNQRVPFLDKIHTIIKEPIAPKREIKKATNTEDKILQGIYDLIDKDAVDGTGHIAMPTNKEIENKTGIRGGSLSRGIKKIDKYIESNIEGRFFNVGKYELEYQK